MRTFEILLKTNTMINISNQLTQRGLYATLAGLIGITFLCATFTWRHDWALAHDKTAQVATPIVASNAVKTPSLPELHIFGQSYSNSEVPISSLQLVITGIVKSEGEASKVYLSLAGQPSKIYQEGDSLPYGVKIYAITADTIILENNGHLEKVPLNREKLVFKSRETTEEA